MPKRARRTERTSSDPGVELGKLETLGAWLHLWTPPRDARVPPVPWRAVGIGTLILVVVVGAVAALVVPRVSSSKRSGEERRAAAEARDRSAERRRLVADQRPVRGVAPVLPDGDRSARVRARRAQLAVVERAITADTRRRATRRSIDGAARSTDCVPFPSAVSRVGAERSLRARRDIYDCLAVQRRIAKGSTTRGGALGFPFRAVIDFESGRYAFCKTNPSAGEAATPDPRTVPELPPACRLER